MTFNGHRFHHDIRYARDQEHYPGLVVHGPLQATILMIEARKLLGRSLSVFSNRSVSPLILESSAEIVSEAMADKGLSLSVSAQVNRDHGCDRSGVMRETGIVAKHPPARGYQTNSAVAGRMTTSPYKEC